MSGPSSGDANQEGPWAPRPASPPEHRRFPERVPLAPAFAAVAAGIAADRFLDVPPPMMFAVAGVSAIAALLLRTRPVLSSIALLAALAGSGAIRHHQLWTLRPATDISRTDLKDDTPVRIVGIVESPVEIREAESSPSTPTWLLLDRSSFNLRAERLIGATEIPVSGLVRVDVSGHLVGVTIGHRIEALGHLRIPGEARDPEGFDLRAWLKSQGIDRAVNVEHPDAITLLGDESGARHRIASVRRELRSACEQLLAENLSSDVRAVGTSLLLGTRTGITDELREAFINSGTMHLLAISGLHVAILAGLVLAACRLLGLSTGWMVFIVLATLWGYTFVTDLRPPVVRSAVFGCLLVAAAPGSRQTSGFNLLAGTALAMLLWNPMDLFDLGAQLSFLAVAAILWSTRWFTTWKQLSREDHIESDPTPISRRFQWFRAWAFEGYLVTAAIWLFTLPLTLAWFHLFSPVGFVINVVLLPFSGPLLAAGFATLAIGLLLPSLAWLPAAAYDLCLRLLMVVVNASAETPFGHVSTPGPAVWQLCVFYALLALAILLPAPVWRRRAWASLGCSIALMLAWAVRPHSSSELVVTFLDVGHGGAVLYQFPGGETALFDAGSFGRGDAAEETIHRALESRRVAGLSALILSHADSDHYNAAAGLLRRIPVGVVYVSQAFPDLSKASISELCETTSQRAVPLRITQAGDSFTLSNACSLEVLHPAGNFRDKLDNAHSIVLSATYAGRTVLVTGDVEKAGVRAMMEAHPSRRVDVFQAPHHGGKMSNTTDLARWVIPQFVVACNRDDAVLPRLREVYADAERILTSASNGTVTATIRHTGELDIRASRGPER